MESTWFARAVSSRRAAGVGSGRGRSSGLLSGYPLWPFGALWLWNLGDDSSLLSPSFAYSASDEATLNGGMFLGLGPEASEPGQPLASEYGLVPTTVYFSVSLYF
ncbi:MAG TPA: hypothetical protein VEK15_05650 [Vicinamibacteria bacterium]|nr:hypothetical protein [Vicinamibacteria bacterium]